MVGKKGRAQEKKKTIYREVKGGNALDILRPAGYDDETREKKRNGSVDRRDETRNVYVTGSQA